MSERLDDKESSASGFVIDGFEGVTDGFTQLTRVSTSPTHVITRAKRYGRWYALKSLAPDVADLTVYQEMLSKEFEITMRLQNPGIVQAVNIEDVPSLGRCIVMEWVDGTDLGQWLSRSPSLAERRKAFNQLLDAVAYLHEMGIVHRDLKPANVMITAVGHNVKVIDFSLADTGTHAEFKQPAGTTGYISPEQAQIAAPDVRNDIFSLGVIMEQMDLGRGYARISSKCKFPAEERYQSISDLKSALRHPRPVLLLVLAGVIAAVVVIMLIVMVILNQPSAPVKSSVGSQDTITSPVIVHSETVTPIDSSPALVDPAGDDVILPIIKKEKSIIPVDSIKSSPVQGRPRDVGNYGAALSTGGDELAFALHKYVAQHRQDTLTDVKYLILDYGDMKRYGHAVIDKYLNSIHDQFNDRDLNNMRRVLVGRCDGYVDWIDELVKSRN
ncbi:MAG: serine/threonine protein kinase [Muribaculaceae bacterium]|nr:serine/threonine protein kinase [Muribaculaceae bacterium]